MFKNIISFSPVMLLCVLLAACGPANAPVNLALNRTVVCSSVEKASDNHHGNDVDLVAAFAVDGDPETRWASAFRSDPDPDAAWIYVDLGQKIDINTVNINWQFAFARVFSIEISADAKTWQNVAQRQVSNMDFADNDNRTIINFEDPLQARYVKVNCKKRATPFGYSIYELEVY